MYVINKRISDTIYYVACTMSIWYERNSDVVQTENLIQFNSSVELTREISIATP